MSDQDESLQPNYRDYMANERTFLAWIRTSIGIMAFGFVVEKFALFLKQISLLLGKTGVETTPAPQHALQLHSSAFGIFIVCLGALVGLLAFVKYKRVEKQIREKTYKPSILLEIMLILSVLAVAAFLIIYLISSI